MRNDLANRQGNYDLELVNLLKKIKKGENISTISDERIVDIAAKSIDLLEWIVGQGDGLEYFELFLKAMKGRKGVLKKFFFIKITDYCAMPLLIKALMLSR